MKFTFDNVVRGLLTAAVVVGVVMLLNRLSGVLLPFFVAWLVAYLLFPLVKFFQYKCRLKFRIVGIICAMLTVALILTGFFLLVISQVIHCKLRSLTIVYCHAPIDYPAFDLFHISPIVSVSAM